NDGQFVERYRSAEFTSATALNSRKKRRVASSRNSCVGGLWLIAKQSWEAGKLTTNQKRSLHKVSLLNLNLGYILPQNVLLRTSLMRIHRCGTRQNSDALFSGDAEHQLR